MSRPGRLLVAQMRSRSLSPAEQARESARILAERGRLEVAHAATRMEYPCLTLGSLGSAIEFQDLAIVLYKDGDTPEGLRTKTQERRWLDGTDPAPAGMR